MRTVTSRLPALLLLALGLAGCAVPELDELAADSAPACAEARCPVVLVDDPTTLGALGDIASLPTILGQRGASLAVLAGPYAVVAATAAADVEAERRTMLDHLGLEVEQPGQPAPAAVGVGLAHSHRIFDVGWLRSPKASFELIGVVPRVDLRRQLSGSCGRLRLVYRLAYHEVIDRGAPISSRLPMTLNADLELADDGQGCAAVADRFLLRTGERADVAWLSRQLAAARALRSIETNLQAMSTPTSLRSDIGGNSDYALRRFEPIGGTWQAVGLPNTPDVDAIAGTARVDALRAWVLGNLAAIDDGSAVLPGAFLAPLAFAAAPRGLARRHNRPFRQLLEPGTVGLPPATAATLTVAKSEPTLLRRLDQLSCQGCHSARSIVGFHLIGSDPVGSSPGNELSVGRSSYLRAVLAWREADLRHLADPGAPAPGPAPLPELAGEYGRHCRLGPDADFAGAAWTCPDGLVCTDLHGDEVGMCLPPQRQAGDPCDLDAVVADADQLEDTATHVSSQGCAPSNTATFHPHLSCSPIDNGFPGGACLGSFPQSPEWRDETGSARCNSDWYGERDGDAICMPVPSAVKFPACILAGGSVTFCSTTAVESLWNRGCDLDAECREDYVCARVSACGGKADCDGQERGACVPPYALLQGRVDGHPVAATAK